VPRYGHAVAVLSVAPRVRVRCWSLADWDGVVRQFTAYIGHPAPDLLGFVIQPEDVNLSPSACAALDELVFERARPKDRVGLDHLALGINALAHESEHIADPQNSESVVECYGMQAVPDAMRLLGGSERYGLRLAKAYYEDLYPYQPPEYRTRACRHGGPLDDDPWSRGWL
jgi:hypothetical protein